VPPPAAPPPPPPVASAAPTAPPAASDTSAPKPETVTADTPRTVAGGTRFLVPAGWTVTLDGGKAVLVGPEPDLKVAIVETSAKSPDDAVAAAWPAIHPDFKRPLKLTTPRPGRHGWDEGRDYSYETSPDEKLVVVANALRHGDGWVVLVLESGRASVEKRNGALGVLGNSLLPAGYEKESFAGKTPHKLDADRIKQLTDFIAQAQDALHVPGVAFSLVQDGQVVYAGGSGLKELGKPAKVDADTLFMIASNTKALTTLLLAEEVDGKKFDWETPVTQVYPDFKLGDADTTSHVLMRHLVCACTGMPRQDLEWILQYKDATPASEMKLLGTMQPTTKFGETFQYSNLMAAAAGFIGGHVAYPNKELGAAYDEAMRSKVFAPLHMTSTTFDYEKALAGNHASPHGWDIDGNRKPATMDIDYSVVPARPAGAAWSSARDLTKYVQMELAKGKLPDGKPLVSEESLMARRKPNVKLDDESDYGMGLMVETKYGITKVHHGGDMIGFHSDMFWLPEIGVGGVILTNADGGSTMRGPFERRVLEVLFDGKPEAAEDVAARAKALDARIKKDRERLVVPADPTVTAKLAKRYAGKELGTIDVKTKGQNVVFDFGEWASAVASRKNDDGTVSMITVDPGKGGFEFVVGEKDGKRVLTIRDMQHEYVLSEATR
jgi:CubicO group peptidase (beta-lactamase class C family)